MSSQVNTTATVKFQNNLELQLNQTMSVLRETIPEVDAKGERLVIRDLIGNVSPQIADERHGDTKLVDTPHDRVHLVKPDEQYFADMVDNADELATEVDLKGGYTMAAMATINRVWDDQDLRGIYAPLISGKSGTVTTPFPAGNVIPVATGASAPAHMNVAKMIAAGQFLDQNFTDPNEERFMILDAVQRADLLGEVPATSSDFKGAYGGEYSNGRLQRLLGFTIIPLELRNPLFYVASAAATAAGAGSIDASGYTRTPFWTKSGLRRGVWQRLRTYVKQEGLKLNSYLVFAGTTVATTRVQAGKVGIILNSEA